MKMVEQNDKPATVLDEINRIVANPDMPKFYSNSFTCSLGTGDISIILKNSNIPIALLNLSYTGAKTLSLNLQQLINHLESKSEHSIMTIDEIANFLNPKK